MLEVCFCGRIGDVRDREPVLDEGGKWLLKCRDCGHLDDLGWLPGEAGFLVWGEAREQNEGQPPKAA